MLVCGDKSLNLDAPQLMGVLNITPDSFSDGGELYQNKDINWSALMKRAQNMVDSGASILDVGGESTRPGATPISSTEEADRVLTVVEKLRSCFSVIISIDTSNPMIMREAATVGANLINDVRALREPGAVEAASRSGLAVCLMHIGGGKNPNDMQQGVDHADRSERPIIKEINDFFDERVGVAFKAGIKRTSLVLDPGFGFGKRDVDNLRILNALDQIGDGNMPLLIGVSRKSTIGRLLGRENPKERIVGGLALVARAIEKGARIIRTHDVGATVDMLKMQSLLKQV